MKSRLKISGYAPVIFLLIIFSCSSVPQPDGLIPPEELADPDSKFIKADGIKFHYKEKGSGDTDILLLHGMMGNLEGWRYLTRQMDGDYRIISYDRPAFGLTERPDVGGSSNPYSPEQQKEQALKLIKKLDMEKPVLLGHSAGGNLALRMAIAEPDSFKALILISPGIFTEIPPALIRELLDIDILEPIGLNIIRDIPNHIDRLLEETYFKPENVSAEMISAYKRPLKTLNWDIALWEYVKAQNDTMIRYNLDKIKIPVLIIQGRQDEVVPLRDNRILAGLLPDARLVIIEDCGHVAHEEKTEETAEVIREFLSRL